MHGNMDLLKSDLMLKHQSLSVFLHLMNVRQTFFSRFRAKHQIASVICQVISVHSEVVFTKLTKNCHFNNSMKYPRSKEYHKYGLN